MSGWVLHTDHQPLGAKNACEEEQKHQRRIVAPYSREGGGWVADGGVRGGGVPRRMMTMTLDNDAQMPTRLCPERLFILMFSLRWW